MSDLVSDLVSALVRSIVAVQDLIMIMRSVIDTPTKSEIFHQRETILTERRTVQVTLAVLNCSKELCVVSCNIRVMTF